MSHYPTREELERDGMFVYDEPGSSVVPLALWSDKTEAECWAAIRTVNGTTANSNVLVGACVLPRRAGGDWIVWLDVTSADRFPS